MGFSRQEYWNGLPFPPPGDLPDPGTEPTSLMSPALAGRFSTTSTTWEALSVHQALIFVSSCQAPQPYKRLVRVKLQDLAGSTVAWYLTEAQHSCLRYSQAALLRDPSRIPSQEIG